MLLLKSQTHNPYFNIATEEYLLKNCNENILFLYRNTPSVIIGKHQIHNLEVNIPYAVKNTIPVVRRISGGGSVFHDLNNLNYSILSSSEKAWVDFEQFTQPLMQHLHELGLQPALRSKSDIRIQGKKISGNASHIYKKRVLHHGSILFATDLEKLTKTLQNKPSCYRNKSVHSRRSIVTNIASHLQDSLAIKNFEQDFIHSLYQNGTLKGEFELQEIDKKKIEELAAAKYQTNEWNVAYNANYNFKNTFFHNNNLLQISFDVEKGFCKNTKAKGILAKEIEKLIKNVPHETSAFTKALERHFDREEVLTLFF